MRRAGYFLLDLPVDHFERLALGPFISVGHTSPVSHYPLTPLGPSALLVVVGLLLAGCGAPEDAAADATTPDPAAEIVAAVEAAPALPEHPFPTPSGRYAVGMTERQWIDEERDDRLTSDPGDRRRVPVRIWYPASPAPDSETALYILSPEEFAGVEEIEQAAHVRTNAVLDAPRAAGAPFPVLVYHHGGSWPRFIGTALGEELASHGYVVASVGHDGFNQSQRRPDGSSTVADAFPFPEPTGDLRSDALASWDHLDAVHFPEWVADARFALDRLAAANAADGPLGGLLDLDRLGMFGWSFGGATAIELLVSDPRVKAAIDMDGQLFGSAAEVGSRRPFLLMKSSELDGLPQSEDPEEAERIARTVDELLAMVATQEDALIAASTGDWYRVEIAGASHGTFSDFLHLAPAMAGTIEPERGHEILAALVREFFDHYLQGKPAPLLEEPTTRFPEITFSRSL